MGEQNSPGKDRWQAMGALGQSNGLPGANGAAGAQEGVALARRVRFAAFEVDLRSGEVRKHGLRIKLQEKPFQVLAMLLERPGQLVTREELQGRLWPADTFVDFDRNLNTAANRLRQALGDSADNPRYIETIPRRGYRLIVPIEELPPQPAPVLVMKAPEGVANGTPDDASAPTGSPAGERSAWRWAAILTGLLMVLGISYSAWKMFRPAANAGNSRIMLVVLPFENLSGDPQQEYVSDGLTDEMITQLGQLHPTRLGVIARTSAMHYKGTRKSMPEIGRELGVAYALEGSVRVSNGRLRVTAQLISVGEQTPLWSETLERDMSDVLGVQREVAGHISRALALELLPAQQRALAKSAAVLPEAYEAYLLGRYHWNKRTREDLTKGLEHFQQAAQKDPHFAAAYAGIADSYLVLASRFYLHPHEAYPQAKAAVQKALELDPDLAEAHASLAGIAMAYDWDWARAEQHFKRAIELNPGYSTAHQWYAEFLSAMGRHGEALAEIEKARSLDPLSLIIGTTLGQVSYQARRFDDALAACQGALEMDPNFAPARVCVAMVYVQKNMEREGATERYRAMTTEGFAKEEADAFWRAYATGGITAARRWLIDYRTRKAEKEYVPGYLNAVIYGALGEKDKAFEWLERSFQQRDTYLVRLKVDPNLDPLRDDPRFQNLLRRMNLAN